VPTREDVLRIRSIEEAFDLSTTKVRKHEVALIRVAERERLIRLTEHAKEAAQDEGIAHEWIWRTIRHGKARSKDCHEDFGRQIGLNLEAEADGRRIIRVKVSWRARYFIATVHTV
jgi:hypothetical protein